MSIVDFDKKLKKERLDAWNRLPEDSTGERVDTWNRLPEETAGESDWEPSASPGHPSLEEAVDDARERESKSVERFMTDREAPTETEQKGEKASDGDEEEKPSALREVLSWILTFVIAIVAAIVIKNYVIINATVPTGSMEHTIEPGDDLFGLRLAYSFSEPVRGDIIIFRAPDDESEKYVKRVIGLPGETVTIEAGLIYIDDSETPLQEDYLKEEWVRATGPYKFVVPKESYLVLGDNRNDSLDARYWKNTYVTKDAIIGKAYMVYYPFSRFGSLYNK